MSAIGKQLKEKLVSNIKDFIQKTGKKKIVVGLSGGLDSAVVSVLMCEAIGSENVTCIHMPNSGVTKEKNSLDAENLAGKIGVKYFVVPINQIKAVYKGLPWKQTKLAEANLSARLRATILYNYANSNNAIVAGTGNKSEFFLGYFTKYGDGAADFFPIGALLKTQVKELAVQLGVPQEIINKPPSADLWAGQEDEKELGVTYKVIDAILPVLLGEKEGVISPEQDEVAVKLKKLIKETEHKRQLAPITPLE